MRETLQSIKKTLEEKQHILIACGAQNLTAGDTVGADAIGSALALYQLLTKLGKQVEIVMSNFKPRPELAFLPHIEIIQNKIKNTKPFVISLPIDNKKISDFSYEIVEHELKIFITPAEGKIDQAKIKLEQIPYIYDLVITVDAPNLSSLGPIYDDNRELFQTLPLINIDHSPANSRFGHINYVDISAAATAELIFQILRLFEKEVIDAPIATCVLAGVISKTKSFKTVHLRPKTLEIAGLLIACGAEREKIVNHFYRTKNIKTLKLWGRVLARLKSDEATGLVWSLVTNDDLLATGTESSEVEEVIGELIYTNPEAKHVALFFERQFGSVEVLFTTTTNHHPAEIVAPYESTGTSPTVKIIIHNKSLPAAEKEFITHLKQKLSALKLEIKN